MAPKNRKGSNTDIAAIFNSLPSASGGSVEAVPTAPSISEPNTWAQVERPDVPETTQQAPQSATDNSFLGRFAAVMDNVVPDDMGGMIRGTSGPLSIVPGYKETAGAVLGGVLSGGESVVNAINWGSEQMNHLGAALASWAPGGIATLDWEQAQKVSFGQVMQANAGISYREAAQGNLVGSLLSITGTGIVPIISVVQDPEQPVVVEENFNVLDPEFQKRAFTDNTAGMLGSGISDAIWLVAADPTIVGGKVTNVLRFGTKAGEFAGLTNRALKTSAEVQKTASSLRSQAQIIKEVGVEAARRDGLINTDGEYLIAAMEGNADTLVNHTWVKSSGNKLAARRLLGRTTMDDAESAAELAGAMMGDVGSMARLREINPSMYDDLATVYKVDTLAPLPDAVRPVAANLPETMPERAVSIVEKTIVHSDDKIRMGDQLVTDALNVTDEGILAGQLITRGGSKISPTMVRWANAYRRGATTNQFVNNPLGRQMVKPTERLPVTDAAQWVAYRLEDFAASRPITLVRWVGKGVPNGLVHLKGGDGTYSLNEVSAFLTKSPIDQTTSASLLNKYAMAKTPTERFNVIDEIENAAVQSIADSKGIPLDAAMAVYKSYAESRHTALASMKRSQTKFGVDPSGEIITAPQFYSQLEEAFPMIDLKEFSRVIDGNATLLRTVEDVTIIADRLNTVWKLSVLLRLGYTQRNVTEGALRSVAALGLVATNPMAWANLPANTIAYAGARRALKASRRADKDLKTAVDNLVAARNLYNEAYFASGQVELAETLSKVNKATAELAALRAKGATKKLTIEQQARAKKLERKIAENKRKAEKIRTEKVEPSKAQVDELYAEGMRQMERVDAIAARSSELRLKYLAKNEKRKISGRTENVMYDGTKMQGAYQGLDGELAYLLASSDSTTYQTFDAAFQRRMQSLARSNDWRVLDPTKMTVKEMDNYWDEYTARLNNQFRTDSVVRMVLEGRSINDVRNWLKTGDGKVYRKELAARGRSIRSDSDVDSYLNGVFAQIDYEIPLDSGLRQLLLDGPITPAQLRSKMFDKNLPTIVGRNVDDATQNLFFKGTSALHNVANGLMKYLGTVPENKILRHPFYNQVYKDRQAQLYRLYAEQGVDMSSAAVKARINKSAHADALKATRETMYTIERYSNAAEMLRFVSPFFPAFENSLRVWGGLAYRNPAILGYGNILWNIPNNLGWVVDQNGNKVNRSNMFRDENTYIVWPEPIADLMRKEYGPFTPGEAVRTRQSGANVLFPGGEPWFPGVGPMTQIPTALILRGKPEETDVLRSLFGGTKEQPSSVFAGLLPGGSPNADLLQTLMPTWLRRVSQMTADETTDSAYLTSYNSILEDAYIQAQIDGKTLQVSDIKKIQEKANAFWRWQVTAAVVMPFQSTRQSPFQMQRDKWNELVDDQSIPYKQKVEKFVELYGTEFLALTRSTSYNETGLQPNITTWRRITQNPDLVKSLYNIDPEMVGMFGNMGAYDDPFSYSVYGEYSKISVSPSGEPVRRKLTADELVRNNQIKDGWREWHEVKDYVEDEAIKRGYSSLEVKDAVWLKDILNKAKSEISTKYPSWGDERDKYENKLPQFIRGARRIVENGDLVGEDKTISALASWLEIRDYVADELKGVRGDEQRDAIKQAAWNAAFALRQTDIGFADLYDQYFANDTFEVVQ